MRTVVVTTFSKQGNVTTMKVATFTKHDHVATMGVATFRTQENTLPVRDPTLPKVKN